MKTLTVRLTGIRPLVMANPQTVRLTNRYAVENRRLAKLVKAARKKNEEDRLAELEALQIRNDWESSAYWDEDCKQFYVPDTVIMASIRAGAAAARKGKDIDRAVIIAETEAYLETVKRPKTLDDAFRDFPPLEGPVRIPPKTGALVWKARCMIPTGWKLTFHIEYNEDIITENQLIEALQVAGLLCGLGGWRPKFGRFTVEILK